MDELKRNKKKIQPPRGVFPSFLKKLLFPALLVAIVTLVFHEVWQHPFVPYDDQILVYENPHYLQKNGPDIAYFWDHPHEKLYMPLTYSVWGILAGVSHLETPIELGNDKRIPFSAQPFHLLNLFLHLINTVLVFGIVRRFIAADWPAFVGALIFGIHPLQVESVAWISELKGVMSGFFALLCLYSYTHHADAERWPSRRRQFLFLLLSLLFFGLALLCKPSAAALPFVLSALELGLFRRERLRVVLSLVPFFLIAGFWAILTRWAQPWQPEIPLVPLWTRPFIAADAIAFYMGHFAWPLQLGINYGRRPDLVLQHWWAFVAWIPIAGVVWLCHRSRKSEPKTALWLFIAPLIPVLGFLPFVFQTHSTVADRYVYLSLLGAALATAWLLTRFPTRILTIGVVAWLMWLGFLSGRQISTWNSPKNLFTQALTVNPNDAQSHAGLAEVLVRDGQLTSAIYHLEQAVLLKPDDYTMYANLGDAYLQDGQMTEALATFRKAIHLKPDSAKSHYNLANVLARMGRLPESSQHYTICLRLNPQLVEAYNNAAITLARQGKLSEAIALWYRGLNLCPNNPEAHFNLANTLMKAARSQEAIPHYQEVLRLAPNFPPARPALEKAMNQAASKASLR